MLALLASLSVALASSVAPTAAAPLAGTSVAQDDTPPETPGKENVGRVTGPDGKPVAGAIVVVRWAGNRARNKPLQPKRLKIETAKDGSFRFQPLPDRKPSKIVVHAVGVVSKTVDDPTGEGMNVRLVREAPPKVIFRLDLRLPDGSAPKKAQVFVEKEGGSFDWHRWDGVDDEFVSEVSPARIHVFGDPYEDIHTSSYNFAAGVPSRWISDVETVSPEQASGGAVTVPLTSRQHLEVTLKNAAGHFSMATHPTLWVVAPEEFRPELGHAMVRGKPSYGVSYRRGGPPKPPTGHIPDVDLGEVIVVCGKFSDPAKAWAKVKIVPGRNRVELEVQDPEANGRFSLGVKTHDGYLAQRLSYRIKIKRPRSSTDASIAPVESRDGRGYFRWSEALSPSDIAYFGANEFDAGQPDVTMLLSVTSTDGAAATVPLQWGKGEYDVVLQPPADVTLVVRGDGAEKFWLQLSSIDAGVVRAAWPEPGNEEVPFGALPSGRYRLKWIARDETNDRGRMRRLQNPTGTIRGFVHAERLLEVRPDHQLIEVSVPELRPVILRLVGKRKNIPGTVRVFRRTGDERSSFLESIRLRVDVDGQVAIRGIGPGEYTATLGSWLKPIDFEVKGNGFSDEVETFEFQVVEAVASRVQITEHGGELAVAGLEHADIIVGLDGERFESVDEVQSCFQRARDNLVVLQVLRGDEELEIELELMPFDPEKGMGGSLKPVFELPNAPR